MINKVVESPDFLFETSWEVCNKVGGIHTVISTKAFTLTEKLNNNYILIGPDVWRDTTQNPEFQEDQQLFKSWRSRAAEEGLGIRIGRWNIAGNPIVIIVDFMKFVPQKDNIFKKFWETYRLDSLSGQWDYVEPALFGYAAGKVIESFTRFHLSIHSKVVAQFHEWMTGTGVLYLKHYMPQIATVFTTHATVLGRSIAGNLLPLYSKLTQYSSDLAAAEFNVIAKQSLEKLSAIECDAYATVSEITSKECAHFHGKPVDLVTPNGFEDSFVPKGEEFNNQRATARKKLIDIAGALTNKTYPDDTLLVGIGGRYEFKNKGIDLFIESLGELNKNKEVTKDILAFIFIPANHYGPRKDLANILAGADCTNQNGKVLTHNLHDVEFDPIIKRIHEVGIDNSTEQKVKMFFVPCYLNGNDGIFNLHYYQVLIGLDLSIFPSYYEPWGYTPLESLAFSVPTITTTLAGFGLWVQEDKYAPKDAITVIDRTDNNDVAVIKEIAKKVFEFSQMSRTELNTYRAKAYELSQIALWKNFIHYYYEAFEMAMQKASERSGLIIEQEVMEQIPHVDKYQLITEPKWKRLFVEKYIPERLAALEILSKNLWWSWNCEAWDLFESIDPTLWNESEKNPIVFLEMISYNRFLKLESDKQFLERMEKVYQNFQNYMSEKAQQPDPMIAYFSMEFGLHSSLKIYSGGLGILAGDYLKEASDANVKMVGIGLLYRYGYFRQVISVNGDQMAISEPQDYSKIPTTPIRDADGNWETIGIVMPGRTLKARIWKVEVGRIDLYLLDTDFEDNSPQDRSITHNLYGGDWENRFKQELLLGVGGIRLLSKLGIEADLFHCNEGHAAFIGLERLHNYINLKNLTFPEALEIVRASTLFTTHTPVPAGHDAFDENIVRMYMAHYPDRLNISWTQFIGLGKVNAYDPHEKFSMSVLAANISQEINGVSRLHGKVSKKMFGSMWPGYIPDELHIDYVTNGVHYPTWTAKEWRQLYETHLDKDFLRKQLDSATWDKIYDIPDKEIWKIRNNQRRKLIDYIKDKMKESSIKRYENPKNIVEITDKLNKYTLTIGFARRFATYKRAHLLFKDLDRLSRIVNNPGMPIQFLFAGKAHPADKAGQDLIKMIIEISHRPEFIGKITFIQNYDMELARHMVQGVDIWLNTPTRPLEASGTSGEKAVMNGVLHFSVLDGWWAEGYYPEAGWALPEEATYENNDFQDELDSELIYSYLENEIAPLFYFRDDDDIPTGWVKYIKNSISKVASNYTTARMLRDYRSKFYGKLYDRVNKLKANDYELTKDLSAWKKKVFRSWESIEIMSVKSPDVSKEHIILGKKYIGEVVLDLNELSPEDLGVEIIVVEIILPTNSVKFVYSQEFKLTHLEGNIATYSVDVVPTKTGAFDFGIRIFPKNAELPHRQDFNLIKWV
ncbi:MAG TPA: alpha-glucan family phosphorylase [Bacteroidales bacterium]|nr:alpha-glucan family phosphorylase [Bacteroidales bacterium]